jgi:hypothetical protein
MNSKRFWLKANVLEYSIFPQLPSFCGIAACCGALSCILDRQITEEMLHFRYGVGLYTKLNAPATCSPENFASLPRSGPGFSNWDVIRLCNSVLLDEGKNPSTALLCGDDLLRETADLSQRQRLFEWLQHDSCQIIIHTVNHYSLVAGASKLPLDGDHYLLMADSARRSGPLRSLAMRDIISLAGDDERYGFILISDRTIAPDVFSSWTSAMTPPEVTEQQRFVRIDKS